LTSLITPEIKTSIKLFQGLMKIVNKNKEEVLLSKLELNDITIDEAKIQSPGYLSSVIRTIEALERASTIEKVHMLQKLFISGDSSGLIEKRPDFYQ